MVIKISNISNYQGWAPGSPVRTEQENRKKWSNRPEPHILRMNRKNRNRKNGAF